MTLPRRLENKTVLIVGAAGNLGPVWVQAALAEGARVIGLGLGVDSDEKLAALVHSHPDSVDLYEVDLTAGFDVNQFMEDLLRTRGISKWDGLVLNAGKDSPPGSGRAEVAEYSPEDWREVFEINVFSLVRVINEMLPFLGNPSSVVSIGSIYALVSPKPELYSHFFSGSGFCKNPAYGASKAAMLATVRQYATHLIENRVRFNTLTLGGVEGNQDEEFIRKFSSHSPQGGLIDSNALGGALIFLLSNDASHMTGHNLVVDGGYTSW